MQNAPSEAYADLTLAVYLEPLTQGRRVLWIGDASRGGPERLAEGARAVLALDTSERATPGRGGSLRVSELRAGPLTFREGSFDLVVVPELSELGEALDERLQEIATAAGPGGVVLVGTRNPDADPDWANPAGSEGALGYEALFERVAQRFPVVRMLGQAPFCGYAVADFEAADAEGDAVVDGSLLADQGREAPARFFALCAHESVSTDAYAVVEFPVRALGSVQREPEAGEPGDRTEALEAELRERRSELEAARQRADELSTTLESRSEQVERLREALESTRSELETSRQRAAEQDESEPERDYQRLEQALADRGQRVLELQQEVRRQSTLARDLIESLRESGFGGPGVGEAGSSLLRERDDAIQRALDAEAARAETQFRADELEAQLASASASANEHTVADLRGQVRGLRSRVAELEEMRDLAEARLQLVERDLEAAGERERALEREKVELQERVELEMMRARSATPAEGGDPKRLEELEASEKRLSERVGTLSGQLMACRDMTAQLEQERDRARAETMRLTAYVAQVENRMEGMRIGYERRIAEMLQESGATLPERGDDELRLLSAELTRLQGERAGLQARLRDRERALETSQSAGTQESSSTEASAERLRGELESMRADRDQLTVRLAEAEERGRKEGERAGELSSAVAARDQLVTRLQVDLAEEEHKTQERDHRLERLTDENERLRQAVVEASERVDASEREQAEATAGQERIEALEQELSECRQRVEQVTAERDRALQTLGDTRQVLANVELPGGAERQRREITAVDADAPEAPQPTDDAAALRERVQALEQDAEDRETLVRSLAAQIEERDDRIRGLERRLDSADETNAAEADGEAARRKQLELEERVARLQQDLEREREARAQAEAGSNAGQSRPEAPAPQEAEQHPEEPVDRNAELEKLREQVQHYERDLHSLRQACDEARNGLEELLGTATATSDPSMADRIGLLLRLLSRG